MFKNLPRYLVAGTVVCAAGYTAHRVQTCRVVGAYPTAAVPGATAKPVLAYPDAQVVQRLNLGYEVYTQDAEGGMTVVPLPPGVALQTTLVLPAAQHRRLSLTLANDKCAAPVSYKVWRIDSNRALGHGQLTPQNRQQQVGLAGAQGNALAVQVAMAEGARNNWFCNVSLGWDDKP